MLRKFTDLLTALDSMTAASQAAFGDEVQCRKGCALCCHGLFDIGILDALLLHKGWRESPDELRSSIEDTAEKYLLAISRIRPEWRYPHPIEDIGEDELDHLLEQIGMVPCPVLGDDLSCSLYSQRPFYCRIHGLKIRDVQSPAADMDTDCELNFRSGTPPRAQWPSHDFTALFAAEGRLIKDAGINADGRFLIPAVVTRRFSAYLGLPPLDESAQQQR